MSDLRSLLSRSNVPKIESGLRKSLILIFAIQSLIGYAPSAYAQSLTSKLLQPAVLTGGSVFNPSTDLVTAQSAQSPTILPTDVIPLPATEERESLGETFGVKILQTLPSKLYCNAIVEASFRNETNVYQFPTKRQIIKDLRLTPSFFNLSATDQQAILKPVSLASVDDTVFRIFPNVTAGWAFTERTRVFANYFLIRDSLFHNPILNSTTQSVGMGVQHDFPLGRKANLQVGLQGRQLFSTNQPAVFDYLPNVTLSYYVNPRTVAFASTLLQLRGRDPFIAPRREIDPFYSFGFVHRRGRWTLSATATYLNNYRALFGNNAQIKRDNQSWILDFEVDRQLFKKLPGLEAFVRAEPIYNFGSDNFPGLSGMDFRLFYGLRASVSKQPLTSAMKNLRKQLEEPSYLPPGGLPSGRNNKKSPSLTTYRPMPSPIASVPEPPVLLQPQPAVPLVANEAPTSETQTTQDSSGEQMEPPAQAVNTAVSSVDKLVQ